MKNTVSSDLNPAHVDGNLPQSPAHTASNIAIRTQGLLETGSDLPDTKSGAPEYFDTSEFEARIQTHLFFENSGAYSGLDFEKNGVRYRYDIEDEGPMDYLGYRQFITATKDGIEARFIIRTYDRGDSYLSGMHVQILDQGSYRTFFHINDIGGSERSIAFEHELIASLAIQGQGHLLDTVVTMFQEMSDVARSVHGKQVQAKEDELRRLDERDRYEQTWSYSFKKWGNDLLEWFM